MSYHNGSIWPHDNSLLAAGFARYELKEAAAMVLGGMMDASIFLIYIDFRNYFAAFHDGPVKRPPCIQLPALRRRGPLVLYFCCCKRVSVSMCLLQNEGWCFRSHSCRNFFRKSAFVI